MDGIIRLTDEQRKTALELSRFGSNVRLARRAHVLVLLDEGRSYRQIMATMHCGSDLIANLKRRMLAQGFQAALGMEGKSPYEPKWADSLCRLVSWHTPQDFGFFRSRWSCGILAKVFDEECSVSMSEESVRQWLHRFGYAWRRPRPIVGPEDPLYQEKMQQIRALLETLPQDQVALFQDEVDINLNPKIGSQWMARGLQDEVQTPGNNIKRYVAGSLSWNTGRLFVSDPQMSRNSQLFIDHLEDLRRWLRSYTKIHIICDNAIFHKSRIVQDYLQKWEGRFQLHFLPLYSPETNPIERVWWHLHETITRNHRCRSMDELVTIAYDWFRTHNNHFVDMKHSFAQAA